jgi:peptidyl-tRNA hydrolase ICT1
MLTRHSHRTSSKATLRVSTASLLERIPKLLHPSILSSRYYAAKSSDLVIQADDSRKQAENVESCFKKLHEVIIRAGDEAVPGETSAEQSQRVVKLQKAEAAGRKKLKQYLSSKKSARRGGGRGHE